MVGGGLDYSASFQRAIELIGKRWTGAVVKALIPAPARFNQLLAGIPGMAMLWRFVPWSAGDPEFQVEEPKRGTPVTPAQVSTRAAVGGIVGFAISVLTLALLEAMRTYRARKTFELAAQVRDILLPSGLGGWLTLVGLVALALTVALTTAAFMVARRGIVARPGPGAPGPPAIPIPPQDLDV